MKKLRIVNNLITKSIFTKKVYIYLSSRVAGDDYDTYENNKVYTNLNPIVIKGLIRQISPEALVWKQYGLHNQGSIELICEDKWKEALQNCNKIVIDDIEYQVYREATGSRTLIQPRPYNLLRVILARKG